MKKVLLVVSLVMCVLLTGCGKNGYHELSYKELNAKLDNKDNFVLVIGSATCSNCVKYEKTMKKVINNKKIEIFYVDIDKFSVDDLNALRVMYNFTGTPTTIFIKDGKEESVYNRIGGAETYAKVIKSLKSNGFLGE